MIDSLTHQISQNTGPTELALRQQEPDYARLAAVPRIKSGAGSCGVQSSTISSTRILRLPELLARLGICRATIYLHMAAGKFPKQIALGPRAVGWLESEVDAWLAQKIQQRHLLNKN